MTRVDELVAALRKPCGRTTGHGDYCVAGYTCGPCGEKARAADVIEYLAKEVVELREMVREMKK